MRSAVIGSFIAFALLIVFLWWKVVDAPLRVTDTDIAINAQGLRILEDAPFSGEVVRRHPNGVVAAIEQFKNGRRHGLFRQWFNTGELAFESFYQSGRREGHTRSWWFNGNPRSVTYYVNGLPDGEARSWYRSGLPFKRFNYVQGQPSGLQQAWRENGKLFSNFEYKNGRVFGLRKANTCVGLENENISVDYYRAQSGDSES